MARASINRDSDVAMIRNPLSDEQCKTMFELSSYAKKHDLLDGFRRKALFQAGRFKEWFPTRVGLLLGALKELIPDLPERSESDLIERTREILSVMETLDLAEMSFSHVGYGDGYTAEALRRGYSEGLVSPQERLLLAELLEDQGKLAEAREVATALIADFPKNLTVQRLCSRLEVGRQTTARAKIGKSAAAVRAKRVMAVGREAKVSSATVAVGRIASAKQKATATSGIPLSRRSVGSKRTN